MALYFRTSVALCSVHPPGADYTNGVATEIVYHSIFRNSQLRPASPEAERMTSLTQSAFWAQSAVKNKTF